MSRDPRRTFARTAATLVDEDLSVALVYAEISGQFFGDVERRHPERVINVGIREQLLVSTGAGLALTGMRPIVHTFASFLVERAFEQIKLDFNHQDVGGVLVGSGGSFDISGGGRTHQAPGDVALIDTLPSTVQSWRPVPLSSLVTVLLVIVMVGMPLLVSLSAMPLIASMLFPLIVIGVTFGA